MLYYILKSDRLCNRLNLSKSLKSSTRSVVVIKKFQCKISLLYRAIMDNTID